MNNKIKLVIAMLIISVIAVSNAEASTFALVGQGTTMESRYACQDSTDAPYTGCIVSQWELFEIMDDYFAEYPRFYGRAPKQSEMMTVMDAYFA